MSQLICGTGSTRFWLWVLVSVKPDDVTYAIVSYVVFPVRRFHSLILDSYYDNHHMCNIRHNSDEIKSFTLYIHKRTYIFFSGIRSHGGPPEGACLQLSIAHTTATIWCWQSTSMNVFFFVLKLCFSCRCQIPEISTLKLFSVKCQVRAPWLNYLVCAFWQSRY